MQCSSVKNIRTVNLTYGYITAKGTDWAIGRRIEYSRENIGERFGYQLTLSLRLQNFERQTVPLEFGGSN